MRFPRLLRVAQTPQPACSDLAPRVLLALAERLAMTLWFSATAVVPQLAGALALDHGAKSWLTMSVQIGFVVGALVLIRPARL